MEVSVKTFEDLSKQELYDILALRAEVFVVEQDCAYQDPDGKDMKALHVLGKDDTKLVAYARIFAPGEYFEQASIGRIVVQQDYRSGGLGKSIVLAAQKAISESYNTDQIKLSAQSYLKDFYEDMGYKPSGEEYLEDGIPHVAMIRD